ncbi:hypothetical protein [Pseudomonas lopnurensis]|uniref:hypothetical protein n=1 Tax=Pseudomonas lopnurensis TaxID=1477517 RepID=UPI0028AEBAA2|nr:hypothetical protein [Pseudomonas lopnurensis]
MEKLDILDQLEKAGLAVFHGEDFLVKQLNAGQEVIALHDRQRSYRIALNNGELCVQTLTGLMSASPAVMVAPIKDEKQCSSTTSTTVEQPRKLTIEVGGLASKLDDVDRAEKAWKASAESYQSLSGDLRDASVKESRRLHELYYRALFLLYVEVLTTVGSAAKNSDTPRPAVIDDITQENMKQTLREVLKAVSTGALSPDDALSGILYLIASVDNGEPNEIKTWTDGGLSTYQPDIS